MPEQKLPWELIYMILKFRRELMYKEKKKIVLLFGDNCFSDFQTQAKMDTIRIILGRQRNYR